MQCTTYPLSASLRRVVGAKPFGASLAISRARGLDNGGICGFSLNLRVSGNCSDGSAFRESGGWIGN